MQEIQKTEKNPSVLAHMAERFKTSPEQLLKVIKTTLIKDGKDADCTNEHLQAFCIVANEYGLNPFTKQIYAFPDKAGGIVPVVGVDGWIAIMQRHPQYNGVTYRDDDNEAWCECSIFRKDFPEPVTVREYMSECKRNTEPWRTHPHRMLRHKALIQCARVAFGLSGIYDRDEAERIAENNELRDVTPKAKKPIFKQLAAPVEAHASGDDIIARTARPVESLLDEVATDNQGVAYHD